MAKFNEMLNSIHQSGSKNGPLAVDEDIYIKIDKNRNFVYSEDFNLTIAYEGDVNSQVVTFTCPARVEGHDLSECANKRLRWCNLASGNEGSSVLNYRVEKDTLFLSWEAPAEAFTVAGDLEVSITFSDYQNGRLVFSWNTSTFKELKVGKTLDKVSDVINGNETELVNHMPARDEILIINVDTRQITEPKGYNYAFCNYGDSRTAVVYFQTRRYVRGIDLLDENTRLQVYWKLKDLSNVERGSDDIGTKKYLYAVELEQRDSEGLVNIVWVPSPNLTRNQLHYHGPIEILLEISSGEKVWRTNVFNKLQIGEYGFSSPVVDLPGEDSNRLNYIIDANAISTDKKVENVAGLVQQRRCTTDYDTYLYHNEIVAEYDGQGDFYGVKIGTFEGQKSTTAPYLAYAPNVTVIVDGGNASEE